MGTKYLGAGVSGHLDAEGRNWDTTVYQQAKPVLDKELNLNQDVIEDARRRVREKTLPSGWLSSDFLSTSDSSVALHVASATANEFEMPALEAHVNGWVFPVDNTNANGGNKVDLGASPTGAGVKRWDLVFLEVWRRSLDATTGTGKSHTAKIWRNGNVKVRSADDAALNYADDILDATLGSETTQRVQVQYRIRVVQGVDLTTYPYGLDDPVVVANSVPAAAASPDGTATTWTYANQSSSGDPGLWVAGDGSPPNTIGSVDGYMYAIPICAIARRNDTAFAKNTNHNGGVATPGPSDRPDGLFYDIIDEKDVLDLRLGVSATGWDYREILQKNWNLLLDNALKTEWETTLDGGGHRGHTNLKAGEIGVDTAGAQRLGKSGDASFDAVRRRFSDRPILETILVKYSPADGSGGGPNWQSGDTVTIDFTALPVVPYAAFNWASFAPSDVTIVDVWKMGFVGSTSGNYTTVFDSSGTVYPVPFRIEGLGDQPGTVTVTFTSAPTNYLQSDLYIWLVVAYPPDEGLHRTPVEDWGDPDSLVIENPASLPATSPILFSTTYGFDIDYPHREVNIQYRTVSYTTNQIGGSTQDIVLPDRAFVAPLAANITINAVPYGGSVTLSDDGYIVTLDPGSISLNDAIAVQFAGFRPFPENSVEVSIYYAARAPQPTQDALLPTSLTVIPRMISDQLYVVTAGSGSAGEGFPFDQGYVQLPGVYPTSGGSFDGDHQLDGRTDINTATFSAATGYVQLPVAVGYVPKADEVVLQRSGGDVDAEDRSFFKSVPTSAYRPSAWAQQLADPKLHRVCLPMIAELPSDTSFGYKGQLVLVVLSRWASDEDNNVAFLDSLAANETSASIYRIQGNLLNRRND